MGQNFDNSGALGPEIDPALQNIGFLLKTGGLEALNRLTFPIEPIIQDKNEMRKKSKNILRKKS